MNDSLEQRGPFEAVERAFPSTFRSLSGTEQHHAYGMTLRDYFAAKVLAIACEDYGPIEAAEMAYRYADAMLEVRK